jgi:hypothetical protein
MRRRGALSATVLVLSWLALDDITTDTADAFHLEYSTLVLAAAWFAALGAWLLAHGHTRTGGISLLAVALGVVAFWSLPHHYHAASAVNYLGFLTLAWFAGISLWLLRQRRSQSMSAPSTRHVPD